MKVNVNIRKRIMLLYCLFVLLPLFAFLLFIYSNTSSIMLSYLFSGIETTIQQKAVYLNNQIDKMNLSMSIISSHTALQDILTTLDSGAEYPIQEKIHDYNLVSDFCAQTQIYADLYAFQIYVKDNFYFTYNNKYFAPISGWLQTEAYSSLRQARTGYHCFLETLTDAGGNAVQYFSIVRMVPSAKKLGENVAGIKATYALSLFDKNTYFSNDYGKMTISRAADTGTPREYNRWVQSDDGRSAYRYTIPVPYSDLLLTTEVSSTEVFSLRNMRFVVMLVLILLVSVATFVFAQYAAKANDKRLRYLLEKIRSIQSGKLIIKQDDLGADEIGIINNSINQMAAQLRESIANRESMLLKMENIQLMAARAQMNALQSQIKPHFLFNTLDLVLWKTLNHDVEAAETLLQNLAAYFRSVLNNGSDVVDVAHELAMVDSYIRIQNMRFDDCIRLSMSADAEAACCALPNITLQPIVENTIVHGLRQPTGTYRLDINITCECPAPDRLRITVADTGRGMPADVMAQLNAGGDGTGCGVRNIRERLQLMFGEEYSLVYSENAGGGVDVAIEVAALSPSKFTASETENGGDRA